MDSEGIMRSKEVKYKNKESKRGKIQDTVISVSCIIL